MESKKPALLKNSVIVFVGSNLANGLNWLFNLAMARMLGPVSYGIFASLNAFAGIINFPSIAIPTVAARYSAELKASGEEGKIRFLWAYLSKRALGLGLAVLLLVVIFSPFIAHFLKLPSSFYLIFITLASVIAFLVLVARGILQGESRFLSFSLSMVAETGGKLILAILLVYLGFQVGGAIGAVVLGISLSWLVSLYLLKSLFKRKPEPFRIKGIGSFSGVSFLALTISAVMVMTDILLVKHFFSPEEAGRFSVLSLSAKIILYLTTPISTAMFPAITELVTRDEKHYSILLKSFLMVLLAGGVALALYFIFPKLVIKILFGRAYLAIAPNLFSYGLAFFFFALASTFVQYYLAIKAKFFLIPLALAAILEAVLLWIYHTSFSRVVLMMNLSMISLFLMFSLNYLYLKRRKIVELVYRSR